MAVAVLAENPTTSGRFRLRFSLRSLMFAMMAFVSVYGLSPKWEPWKQERRIEYSDSEPMHVAFTADGQNLAWVCSSFTTVLWDLRRGEFLGERSTRYGGDPEIMRGQASDLTAFSRDATRYAEIGAWGVTLADVSEYGKPEPFVRRTLGFRDSNYMAVLFSPDDRWLMLADGGGQIEFWGLTSDRLHRFPTGHKPSRIRRECPESGVVAYAFSPDGRLLATGGWEGRVRVWTVPYGEMVSSWNVHPYMGDFAMTFSADGTRLLTSDGRIGTQVWDFRRKKPLFRAPPDGERVQIQPSVAVTEAGDRVAAITAPNAVTVWRRVRGEGPWGFVGLPESWVAALCSMALIWSLWRDRAACRSTPLLQSTPSRV